jgi:hypothetical protein
MPTRSSSVSAGAPSLAANATQGESTHARSVAMAGGSELSPFAQVVTLMSRIDAPLGSYRAPTPRFTPKKAV